MSARSRATTPCAQPRLLETRWQGRRDHGRGPHFAQIFSKRQSPNAVRLRICPIPSRRKGGAVAEFISPITRAAMG